MGLEVGGEDLAQNKDVDPFVILLPCRVKDESHWYQETVALITSRLTGRRSIKSPPRHVINAERLARVVVLGYLRLATKLVSRVAAVLPDILCDNIHFQSRM